MIDQKKLINMAEAVAYPTVYLTHKSPKKWVRALGQLGVIPLLPWVLIGGFLGYLAAAIVSIADDWWEAV